MSINQQTLVRQSRNPFRTHDLTNILFPSVDGGYRDQYRSGWLPSWFNQQWGGAQWGTEMQDAITGQTYKFSAATSQIQDDAVNAFGATGITTLRSMGFKVSENITVASIWVKLNKVLNPVDNIQILILADDGTGKPTGFSGITNGASNTISARQITSSSNGEWYRFTFSTPPSLTANTQYHFAIKRSGAVDASNYIQFRWTTVGKYPGGLTCYSDGATWTKDAASPVYQFCFIVEPSASTQVLQPAGVFDQKFIFNEGTPVNQSRSLCQPLKNFFDGKEFTAIGTFSALTKDKTFADFVYGLDHDRVTLRSNVTTGFPQVDVYDILGVKRSVTGTVDVSTGNHQIGVRIRAKGDGADRIDLLVDGAINGTSLINLTLNFDNAMREQGTAWLGGGFAAAPTWTQSMTFTTLPSIQGWAWTGTATEANAMSVSGGKLYQNKGGYASTDTGYYLKATAGLSNTNGWTVEWKGRVSSNSNTPLTTTVAGTVDISIYDGSKRLDLAIQEYFLQSSGVSATTQDFIIQSDFKSQERVIIISGKGSDYYVWLDGKLIIDGTGKLLGATASNQIIFGDTSAVAAENADATYSYLKYYTTAAVLPQATSGSLSEFAYWSGDKISYAPDLYNAGSFVSTKKYCGLEKNYVESVVQKEIKRGITSAPSTTSTSLVLVTDLEIFSIGSSLEVVGTIVASNTTPGNLNGTAITVDGSYKSGEFSAVGSPSSGTAPTLVNAYYLGNLGLHKSEFKYSTSAGTITALSTYRELQSITKS